MSTIAPMCISCIWYDFESANPVKCKAYPEGIPDEILNSSVDHREPYDDDQGIHFEQNPDRPEPHAFELFNGGKAAS